MRTTIVVLRLMVVLVVAIGLLVACGGPTPTQPTEPPREKQPTTQPTEPPQEEQPTAQLTEPPQEEQPTAQPLSGDGEALLQQTCAKCHGLDRIQQAQKTRNEWEQTYARMMAKGDPAVPVSEDELDILIEYLAETYGP